jgi:hypothetical protein
MANEFQTKSGEVNHKELSLDIGKNSVIIISSGEKPRESGGELKIC